MFSVPQVVKWYYIEIYKYITDHKIKFYAVVTVSYTHLDVYKRQVPILNM